jgi:hypothetical protein
MQLTNQQLAAGVAALREIRAKFGADTKDATIVYAVYFAVREAKPTIQELESILHLGPHGDVEILPDGSVRRTAGVKTHRDNG